MVRAVEPVVRNPRSPIAFGASPRWVEHLADAGRNTLFLLINGLTQTTPDWALSQRHGKESRAVLRRARVGRLRHAGRSLEDDPLERGVRPLNGVLLNGEVHRNVLRPATS